MWDGLNGKAARWQQDSAVFKCPGLGASAIKILALLLTGYANLDKLFNLCAPVFFHL